MKRPNLDVRFDPETIVKIDALIPQLSTPWHESNRSEVLRMLIQMGLDAHPKPKLAGTDRPLPRTRKRR